MHNNGVYNEESVHREFHAKVQEKKFFFAEHFFCLSLLSQQPSVPHFLSFCLSFFRSSYHLITFLFTPSLVDFLFVLFSYQQTVKMCPETMTTFFFVHQDGFFSSCAFAYLAIFFSLLSHSLFLCAFNSFFLYLCPNIYNFVLPLRVLYNNNERNPSLLLPASRESSNYFLNAFFSSSFIVAFVHFVYTQTGFRFR